MAEVVAGIDVGAERKGCNLVILRGTVVVCSLRAMAPEDVLAPCLAHNVAAIGVDAPARWRSGSAARLAERELARSGVSLFSTPQRASALASTSGFYGWMFHGERVYQALAPHYPLLATPGYAGAPACFETFPHAITAAFLGHRTASARLKLGQRRQILASAGIATSALRSIDAIDAALCALAAQYLVAGRAQAFGDAAGGYIHIPAAAP